MNTLYRYLLNGSGKKWTDIGKFFISIGFLQIPVDEFNSLIKKDEKYIENNYFSWCDSLISTTYYITNALDYVIKNTIDKKYNFPEPYSRFREIRRMWVHPITNYMDDDNQMTASLYSGDNSMLTRQIKINSFKYANEAKINKLKLEHSFIEELDILCEEAIIQLEDIIKYKND